MAIDRNAFGFESTTDEVLDGISLEGRRAVITGTSGGLGAETARALAARGAKITLAARNLDKLEAVAASIRESTGNPNIDIGALDLTSADSIRGFAANWLASHDALNLLVNNAGIMACPLARTPEGWELQFATNHLGHFLLTALLAPALVAAAKRLMRTATERPSGDSSQLQLCASSTNSGFPGGWGMPRMCAVAMYSLVSQKAVVGASVATYSARVPNAASAAVA